MLIPKLIKLKNLILELKRIILLFLKTVNNSLISLSVDMVRCDAKRFCEAISDKATIKLDLIEGSVIITKRKFYIIINLIGI